jgi:hypothetical protein
MANDIGDEKAGGEAAKCVEEDYMIDWRKNGYFELSKVNYI